MRTRQDHEQLEEKNLAPYAMKSREAGEREYPEDKHPIRTCFQRDRDRIVHCEAFRNLEYKTQVFIIFEGDYYRTRLTHTIEVGQIGRTIGRALHLNEDLIEAVALAHDLGHPPFGHAGEDALNVIIEEANKKDPRLKLKRFNHNMRSFDIVTRLEKRYPNFDGLNLTPEVLIGILKHETDYDEAGESKGYKDGPTIEARVVDFADSLAYLNHDIDDGLTSGCIAEADLMDSDLWQNALKELGPRIDRSNKKMLKYQIVKQLIDMQIKDLLTATDQRLKDCGLKSSKEAKDYLLKEMRRRPKETLVGFSREMTGQRDHLQRLLFKKLYNHYRVIRMMSKAKRVLNDLFKVYWDVPEQLPPEVYKRAEAGEGGAREKYDVICNHLASMTDRSALEEHKKLFNPYTKV